MQPDNLISLKDDMVAFIAGHGMRRLNAYITEDVPTVLFEEENPDGWKDFVEHAKAAGAPFVTMSEVVLEKSDVAILLDQLRDQSFPDDEAIDFDDAEYLVNYVGKVGTCNSASRTRASCSSLRSLQSGMTVFRTSWRRYPILAASRWTTATATSRQQDDHCPGWASTGMDYVCT